MTTTMVIVLLCTAAVAFMVRVFIAFCKDQPSKKCHVVHILTRVDRHTRDERSWGASAHQPALFAPARGAEDSQVEWNAPVEAIAGAALRRVR